jgi:tetratricopeptide (TPR) repeat protein
MSGEKPWRSRPVFVSSTFQDMQAERDCLVSQVFPALEEALRARRTHLELVDLRLGVETAGMAGEPEKQGQVLKVCLDEIDRCRPFLVVFLGDRYGWVPPKTLMDAIVQEKGLGIDTEGKSVVALEIEYGVLEHPEQRDRTFFYFRDRLPYEEVDPATGQDIPSDLKAAYSEAHATDAGREQGHRRLLELKHRIREELPDRCRSYAATWDFAAGRVRVPKELVQRIKDDLLEALVAEAESGSGGFAQNVPPSDFEQFIESRARGFVGRDSLVGSLLEHATSPQEATIRGCCVTGVSGAGKSAVFARVYQLLRKREDRVVLSHAAGIGPHASRVNDLLRRWIVQLADHATASDSVGEAATDQQLEEAFAGLLRRASQSKRVVVLIDALDQLERTDRGRQLTWLPAAWPANARLMAFAVPGSESATLLRRPGMREMPLAPLSQEEAHGIAREIYARYHRTPNDMAVLAIIEKSAPEGQRAAGSPLWLTMALEHINLFDEDDFARADRNFGGTPEQRLHALVVHEAQRLPPTVEDLYAHVFARTETHYGMALARAFAALIAASRGGFRTRDLEHLIPRVARVLVPDGLALQWSDPELAALRRGFRGHLLRRGPEDRWDFFHQTARLAVHRLLLGDARVSRQIHAAIADHLWQLSADDGLRDELMFHLVAADDRARAARYCAEGLVSGAEKSGAIHTLAELISAGAGRQPNPGLEWTASLLEQPGLTDPAQGSLCNLLNRELGDRLANQADLTTLEALLERTGPLLTTLAEADPSDVSRQEGLSLYHQRRGELLCLKGDLHGARAAYGADLDILRRLAGMFPQSGHHRHELRSGHEQMGKVQLALGDLPGALSAFVEALKICAALVAAEPANAGWQLAQALAMANIAGVCCSQGDSKTAFEAYGAALAVCERLSRADPGNTRCLRELSMIQNAMGDILRSRGDLDGAMHLYQEALSIRRQLATREPTVRQWQLDVAMSHERLGDLYRDRADWGRAREAYGHKQEIIREILDMDPTNASVRRAFVAIRAKTGETLLAQGEPAGARDAFAKALELCQGLVAMDEANAEWQRDLAMLHSKIGEVHLAQGDLESALRAFREDLAITKRLATNDSSNAELDHDLSVSHEKVGDVLLAQRALAGALEAYGEAKVLREKLVASDPARSLWKRDLAASECKLGDVLFEQSDLEGADRAYSRAVSLMEEVTAASPSHPVWRDDLCFAQWRLVSVHQAQQRRLFGRL